MRFEQNFIADDYHDEFQPVPAGNYIAKIIDSEDRQTKAGNGEYLQLKLEIISGQQKGRYVFDRLNLKNPNQQAMNIAKATLGNIMRAIKMDSIIDTDQIHGLPLVIKVTQRENNGKMYNDIKGYSSAEGFCEDDLGATETKGYDEPTPY